MKKKALWLFIMTIFILGLGGCSSKVKTKDNTLRIAFFPNITHAQALIAKSEKKLEKSLGEEYTVEWKQFNAGASQMEALLAGEIDIGYIGPGPAINAYARTKGDIVIIAGATNAGAVLVSRKDLDIENIKELEGKRVAVPQYGNTQDLTLRYILQKNNLKDTTKGGTVEILQAQNADILSLLSQGQIDAAMVPEPWGTRLQKEVQAKVILEFNEVFRQGNYPTALIVARKDFLEKNPEVVKKFLEIHVDTTKSLFTELESKKEIVNNQIKELTQKELPKDLLDSSFERLISTYDPNKEAVTEMVELSLNIGFLRIQPDLKDFFQLELLNEVLREKGEKEIQ